jgi:hypothetical protein
VAVLEELQDEQQPDLAEDHAYCAFGVGNESRSHCAEHMDQEWQQQQEGVGNWRGGSSLTEQAAVGRREQLLEAAPYKHQHRAELAAGAAGVAAASSFDAASALFGSLMPSMGASELLQLEEVPEGAVAGPAKVLVADAVQLAAAEPLGGWRQRKQQPAGRRRVSGSAAASLF